MVINNKIKWKAEQYGRKICQSHQFIHHRSSQSRGKPILTNILYIYKCSLTHNGVCNNHKWGQLIWTESMMHGHLIPCRASLFYNGLPSSILSYSLLVSSHLIRSISIVLVTVTELFLHKLLSTSTGSILSAVTLTAIAATPFSLMPRSTCSSTVSKSIWPDMENKKKTEMRGEFNFDLNLW